MKFVPAVKNKDRKREGGKDSEHLELRCEIRERGHKAGAASEHGQSQASQQSHLPPL